MNRHDRRAAKAEYLKNPLAPARRDGRPLYFEIAPGDRVQCVTCLKNGITQQYGQGEGFMNDPANSPEEDGSVYTICLGHIPDNAVIFSHFTKLCRNKAGDETWEEG